MKQIDNIMIRGILSNKKGFTLVETLISILIVSVAILGLSAVTVSVIKSNEKSRDKVAAVTLAQDKLEELKNLSYSNANLVDGESANNADFSESYLLSTTTVDFTDTKNPLDDKGGTSGHRKFYRYWNVADAFNGYTDTKTIVAIVTWTAYGVSNKVYLTTIRGS